MSSNGTDEIRIDRRFQGPPDSGNGGYVCGRLAAFVRTGPAVSVRLHAPPPLETGLAVRRRSDAHAVLCDGDRVVAEARTATLDLDVANAPSFEAATEAARSFRGLEEHAYPGCFVCGPDRAEGDGLRIFAGPAGDGCVAGPWVADTSLATASPQTDRVAPEFVWAAIDCPGGFAFEPKPGNAVLLGELCGELLRDVRVGEPCVLTAWEIASEGRKHFVGTALFGAGGVCAARARATWIEVPAP